MVDARSSSILAIIRLTEKVLFADDAVYSAEGKSVYMTETGGSTWSEGMRVTRPNFNILEDGLENVNNVKYLRDIVVAWIWSECFVDGCVGNCKEEMQYPEGIHADSGQASDDIRSEVGNKARARREWDEDVDMDACAK